MPKIFCCFILFIISESYAQPYIFSKKTENYAALNTPIAFFDVEPINLPFKFKFYEVEFDTIHVAKYYGAMAFNTYAYSLDVLSGTYAFKEEYTSLSYEIIGNIGDRICKIQWENAIPFSGINPNDTLNFQVWLFEKDHSIEIHTGPNNISQESIESGMFSGYNGPGVALYGDTIFYFLSGDPENPDFLFPYGNYNSLFAVPEEGTVYRFEYLSSTSIKSDGNRNNKEVQIIYGSSGHLIIENPQLKCHNLTIYNVNGSLISKYDISERQKKIPMNLSSGIYIAVAETDNGVIVKKLSR